MNDHNTKYINNILDQKNLSARTRKAHILKYTRIITFLKKNNILLINFHKIILLNPNVISSIKYFISLQSLASRDTYVSLLTTIIAPDKRNIDKNYIELKEQLTNYFYKLRTDYRGKDGQKKSKTQKDNWISYDKLVQLNKKLTKQYKQFKLNRSLLSNYSKSKTDFYKNIIEKSFFDYSFYVALNIHLKYPLRLEIGDCIICSSSDRQHLPEEEKNNNVYLVNSKKKKKTLYMGKNSRKNKMKKHFELELPVDLCNIINVYITMRNILMNPTDPTKIKHDAFLPLFFQSTKKDKFALSSGLNKNNYSKMLSRNFVKHLNKNISATLIRQITVSHFRKGEKSEKEKQELAILMNNSVEVQTKHYLKFD